MPQQVHIAQRVEVSNLINQPEEILYKFSIKITEKRNELLQSFLGKKIQFKNAQGNLFQGTCTGFGNENCNVRLDNDEIVNVKLTSVLF